MAATIRSSSRNAGDVLVQVHDDLRRLREQLIAQSEGNEDNFDFSILDTAISRTQDNLLKNGENLVALANDKVSTMPVFHPSHDRDEDFGQPFPNKHYRDKLAAEAQQARVGDENSKIVRILSKRPIADKPGIYNLMRSKQSEDSFILPPLVSFEDPPGVAFKHEQELQKLLDPTNPDNRRILFEKFGISLPVIVHERGTSTKSQKLYKGTHTENMAVLPKSHRVYPQLDPPPISETDASKGLLSLLERGLIPPASELCIEPSPIKQKTVQLHDHKALSKRKNTPEETKKSDTSLSEFKLDPNTQLVNNDTNKQLPPPDLKSLKPPTQRELDIQLSSSRVPPPTTTGLAPVKTMQSSPYPPPVTPSGDHYKLMQHRFVIQMGQIKSTSPEFNAFRQHFCLQWGSIVRILRMLEEICSTFHITVAFVNGDRVAEMAQKFQLEMSPSRDELLSATIINFDSVMEDVKRPGQRFKAGNGKHLAAILIQSTWRMYKDRSAYILYRRQKWAAGMIAISWIMNAKLSKIRKQLLSTQQIQMQAFKERQRKFGDDWDVIKQCRRTIIHIPSLGYDQNVRDKLKAFPILQNRQMARLCDVADSNVEVIYVSPVELSEEFQQYFSKLLSLQAAVKSSDVTQQESLDERYHIIVPEAVSSFPTHNMCLATHLKYSPATLQRIKNLIAGKDAYIVPGSLHKDDLYLADALDAPVMAPSPDLASVYQTKSGLKRIFSDAKVKQPPHDVDIKSLNQMQESFSQLVTENLNVKRWLIKIDNEFNGRGIAMCDITAHLKCHGWALRQMRRNAGHWNNRWAHEPVLIKISEEIPNILADHAIPCCKSAYPTWTEFLSAFLSVGGVIEACPPSESITALTIDFLIEPSGGIQILSQGDQIHAENEYSCWGTSVPQCSVDPEQLNEETKKIASAAKSIGVIGYLSAVFVTFIDMQDNQLLWAVDLNFGYSDQLAMTNMMLFITNGVFNPVKSLISVAAPPSKPPSHPRKSLVNEKVFSPTRYAVLSTKLYHTNLSIIQYSVFFQLCRAHGIGYDIAEKQGCIFTLMDSNERSSLGLICIHEKLPSALATFARNISVIHQEISSPGMLGKTNIHALIKDVENILGVTIQNEELKEDA